MTKKCTLFLSFGLLAAGIFPFYANFFVEWKPGMLKFFVLGCVVAGVFVGSGNFLVFRSILKKLHAIVSEVTHLTSHTSLPRFSPADDLYNSFVNDFIIQVEFLQNNQRGIEKLGRELAEGVEAIRLLITSTSNIARGVAARTQKASSAAAAGEMHITNTFNSCNHIQRYLEDSMEKMRVFEAEFSEISTAAATITSLSQQTDILATNASITAARAGELGKEFSVVAVEVKKLAHRSREVTNKIGSHINATRRVAQNALAAIEQASREFSQHADQFTATSNHLLSINASSHTTLTDVAAVIDKLSALSDLSSNVEKSAEVFLTT